MKNGELLTNTRVSARPGIRQCVTFQYAFKGMPICWEMFLFLHRISRTRLYSLVKHLYTNGIVPRTRGNKGKLPKHLMQSSTEEVNILKTDVSINLQELPEVIPTPGIPPERQKYLYEQNKNVL